MNEEERTSVTPVEGGLLASRSRGLRQYNLTSTQGVMAAAEGLQQPTQTGAFFPDTCLFLEGSVGVRSRSFSARCATSSTLSNIPVQVSGALWTSKCSAPVPPRPEHSNELDELWPPGPPPGPPPCPKVVVVVPVLAHTEPRQFTQNLRSTKAGHWTVILDESDFVRARLTAYSKRIGMGPPESMRFLSPFSAVLGPGSIRDQRHTSVERR